MVTGGLGKKEFISLPLPRRSSSWKAVRAGISTRQEPGGRSRHRGHGVVLLTGMLAVLLLP